MERKSKRGYIGDSDGKCSLQSIKELIYMQEEEQFIFHVICHNKNNNVIMYILQNTSHFKQTCVSSFKHFYGDDDEAFRLS